MKIKGNKTGWLFKAAGGEVGLDNSVYFDAGIRHSASRLSCAPISEIRTWAGGAEMGFPPQRQQR